MPTTPKSVFKKRKIRSNSTIKSESPSDFKTQKKPKSPKPRVKTVKNTNATVKYTRQPKKAPNITFIDDFGSEKVYQFKKQKRTPPIYRSKFVLH
jgi:UDP-galactopyranose mutase